MLVVGLVGKIASGKGETARFLESDYGAEVYRFSDILRDLLEKLSMPVTRENLQALGRLLRQLFGDSVLVDALRHDITASDAKIVVVDGVRYMVEAEMIRSFEKNLLLFVDAPDEVRYERARSRGTRGEEDITFEDFLRNEADETERAISEVAKTADAVIENTGTIEELREKVKEIIEKI